MELTDVLKCCLKGTGDQKALSVLLGVPERIYVQTQSKLIQKKKKSVKSKGKARTKG